MNTAGELYSRVWHPGAVVVSMMERYGLLVDVEECRRLHAGLMVECAVLKSVLDEAASPGVNWASPTQVSAFLYGTLGLPIPPVDGTLKAVKLTKKGARPTGEAALDWLQRTENVHWIGTLRTLKKKSRLATFFELLPHFVGPGGRIHSQLKPSTETGRLSSRNPNLQQIPKVARSVLVAPPGYRLLALDQAGLEWRILAHILAARYDDWSLVNDVKAGIDPHGKVAVGVFGLRCAVSEVKKLHPKKRDEAKAIAYGINYGKTAVGLAVQLNVTEDDAQDMLDAFYRTNPSVKVWHEDCVRLARVHGARTLLGRVRRLPDLESKHRWVRESAERLAMNTPIQGSAMDLMTCAALRCDTSRHPDVVEAGWGDDELACIGVKQLLQIHDELLFEVPEDAVDRAKAVISERMAAPLDGLREFLCPLEVTGGHGSNWKEAGE